MAVCVLFKVLESFDDICDYPFKFHVLWFIWMILFESHCFTFHTILMMRPGQVDSYVSCVTVVDREGWPLDRALGRAQTGLTRLCWALFVAPNLDLVTGRYIARVGSGRPTRPCESTDVCTLLNLDYEYETSSCRVTGVMRGCTREHKKITHVSVPHGLAIGSLSGRGLWSSELQREGESG